VRVTVIAAGFDSGSPARKPVESAATAAARTSGSVGSARAGSVSAGGSTTERRDPLFTQVPAGDPFADDRSSRNGSSRPAHGLDEADDEVDVPPFMKR